MTTHDQLEHHLRLAKHRLNDCTSTAFSYVLRDEVKPYLVVPDGNRLNSRPPSSRR